MNDGNDPRLLCAAAADSASQTAAEFGGSIKSVMDGAGEEKFASELASASSALRRLARKLEKRLDEARAGKA